MDTTKIEELTAQITADLTPKEILDLANKLLNFVLANLPEEDPILALFAEDPDQPNP